MSKPEKFNYNSGLINLFLELVLRRGVPISIAFIIIFIFLHPKDGSGVPLRINVPLDGGGYSSLVDTGKGIHLNNEINIPFFTMNTAIFEDGSIFNGHTYSLGNETVKIEPEFSIFASVKQIDANRALVWEVDSLTSSKTLYLFTKGGYPNYSLEKLKTIPNLGYNSKIDFIEKQDGTLTMIMSGAQDGKVGLYSVDLNTNSDQPKLLIETSVATFASNSHGDTYVISQLHDLRSGNNHNQIIYGTIENGVFKELNRADLPDIDPFNILPEGIEVTDEGGLVLLVNINPNSQAAKPEDVQIVEVSRKLITSYKSTLDQVIGNNGDLSNVPPFLASS